MKITKAAFKIGADTFEFEPDAVELKEQFAELYNLKPRTKCDVCGNIKPEKFRLWVNKSKDKKDKEWTYVKVICDCGAASTLGTFLDNKGYFWKKFEKYTPKSE